MILNIYIFKNLYKLTERFSNLQLTYGRVTSEINGDSFFLNIAVILGSS